MFSRGYLIRTEEELDLLIDACIKSKYASVDFETNGEPLYNHNFKPTILSVTFKPGFGVSIPLLHHEVDFITPREAIRWLKKFGARVISNPDIVKIAWNWKYDNQIFKLFKIFHRGTVIDGMLAKYILNEERPNGLKDMVRRYLPIFGDYEKSDGFDELPWDRKPLDKLVTYGCQDTDYTFRLGIFFESRLIEKGFYPLYRNLIMAASRVLQDAEACGLPMDLELNKKLIDKYAKLIDEYVGNLRNIKRVKKYQKVVTREKIDAYIDKLNKEIEELREQNKDGKKNRQISSREAKISRILAGEFTTNDEKKLIEPINFGSTKQLIDLLFIHPEGFQFPIIAYTVDSKTKKETNNPSTSEDTLIKLKKFDTKGFIDELLKLRGVQTINSTFIVGFSQLVQDDGRLHPKFLIHGTTSGRLSCISGTSLVLTNKGEMPISEVQYNLPLKVMTRKGWRDVNAFIYKGKDQMYKVELEDGSSVTCTLDHIFITDKGPKKLRNLDMLPPNNMGVTRSVVRLLVYNGSEFKKASIKRVTPVGVMGVYDLSVNGCHEFVADGILHHNSREPNGQNIPKTMVNPDVKPQLIAPPGELFLAYDYSQAELRILAHLANETTMLEWFRTGKDIHLASACKKYHEDYDKILEIYSDEQHPEYKLWKKRRKNAKTINFGIVYEQSAGKLAETLSTEEEVVTPEEGQEFLDDYFRTFPKVKRFMDKQHKFMEDHGYCVSLFGRKRRCPNVYSDNYSKYLEALRQSTNMPCQSSASDMALFASVIVYEQVKRGILPPMVEADTVHDSVYQFIKPQYITADLIYKLWDICRNPSTKEYFGFSIDDVDMSMDFTIGRTMAEELPFIPGYDYRKLLQPDFNEDEYYAEYKKYKHIAISEYPKQFKEMFKRSWREIK